MFDREESGYGSADSITELFPPKPVQSRIANDAIRLQEEFEVTELLMNSANGVLYQGTWLRTGETVIFKQIPRTSVPKWLSLDGALVPAEIAHHFTAYRKSRDLGVICKPIAWLEKRSSFVLILEKVGGENCCDLFELSKKYGAISEDAAKIIFRQLLNMWRSLELSTICHRDLKDENIIIDAKTLECRLIDFGCATRLSSNEEKSFAGTPEFFPPEWFLYGTYRHESLTAWSLGVILFILLTGQLPTNIKRNVTDFCLDRDAGHLLRHLSTPAKALLRRLLEPEPSIRANLHATNILMKQW